MIQGMSRDAWNEFSKIILVRYILSYLCGTLYLDSSASWKKIFAFSVGVFLAFQLMPYLPEWVIWEWWAFQWHLIASENSRNFLLDFTFFISKSMNVVNLQLIINPEMVMVTIRYGSLRLAYCLLESRKMKIRREVLTLKCNWSSLKICVALWDNYAYFLPTYWSAVTFKRSYSNANQQWYKPQEAAW